MKIALLGDIGLFGRFSVKENPGALGLFDEVRQALSGCDVVVGNLETPLTDSGSTVLGKSAYIKGSPADIGILRHLGVTHVNLANNHIFDYGTRGFLDTVEALDQAGIKYFGVDNESCLVQKGDSTIALHGYCCLSSNPLRVLRKGRRHGVHLLDPNAVERTLLEDRQNKRLSVVSCHWGEEHTHYPNPDHVATARRWAGKAPFVLYGHHPHMVQGIEQVSGALLAYSLGNFCFDDVYTKKSRQPTVKQGEDNKTGMVLILSVHDSQIESWEAIPFADTPGKLAAGQPAGFQTSLGGWSGALSDEKGGYQALRKSALAELAQERMRKRDFGWYVKRLNLNTAVMLARAFLNSRKYKLLYRPYLAGKGE